MRSMPGSESLTYLRWTASALFFGSVKIFRSFFFVIRIVAAASITPLEKWKKNHALLKKDLNISRLLKESRDAFFKKAFFFFKIFGLALPLHRKNGKIMKAGIISDTHSFLDDAVFRHFEDCDEIWHAG